MREEERFARRGAVTLVGAREVRKVSTAGDGGSGLKVHGGAMLPEELRPAPSECLSTVEAQGSSSPKLAKTPKDRRVRRVRR